MLDNIAQEEQGIFMKKGRVKSRSPEPVNPWGLFFFPTLGLWGSSCILAMMYHKVGYYGAIYTIGSGLVWIAVAIRASSRPDPSSTEVLIYRLWPLILWSVTEITFEIFQTHAA